MHIGEKIRLIREQRGMLQKQIANEIGIGYSNYNKLENGGRDASVEELSKLAKLFGITIDDIVNLENQVPEDVHTKNKSTTEKVGLINELDTEEQEVVFKIIDTMLAKKRLKNFIEQQYASFGEVFQPKEPTS